MASMNYPRISPKITQCGQYLYASGGGINNIERFNLKQNNFNLWEILKITLPNHIFNND